VGEQQLAQLGITGQQPSVLLIDRLPGEVGAEAGQTHPVPLLPPAHRTVELTLGPAL